MAGRTARRPHDDDHPPSKEADGDEPALPIVKASVLHLELRTGEHLIGIGKVEPRSASGLALFTGSNVILIQC